MAYPCKCEEWAGPFLHVKKDAVIIVHTKVLKYFKPKEDSGLGWSMDIKITKLINGEEKRNVIRVWGDNGALCRPHVTQFPINTQWMFILFDSYDSSPEEPVNDYSISNCGEYWLKIKGNYAYGQITKDTKTPQKMKLKDLERLIRKK